MTKKLEEVFNLDSFEQDEDEIDNFDSSQEIHNDEYDIDDLQGIFSEVDKIDRALPAVRGLEAMDSEMDDIKERSMQAFKDIMDYGNNVEDRHAAPLFDSASKMLQAAITATQSKTDRKLKAIQLQIQKSKIDLERDKLNWKQEEARLRGDSSKPIEGNAEEFTMSRNDLIKQIIEQQKSGNS
jgi:hypothetical protein